MSQSCEHIRVSLEQLEPERDMENFVRDYGTGNEIPEPPRFINYSSPDAMRQANQAPQPRYAHFPRASARQTMMAQAMRPAPPEDEPTDPGQAGRGAGGAGLDRLTGPPTTASQSRPSSRAGMNGGGEAGGMSSQDASPTTATHPQPSSAPAPAPAPAPVPAQGRPMSAISSPVTTAPPRPPQPPTTQPSVPVKQTPQGPEHKTMLQIGDNAYEVDPEKDPQQTKKSGPGSMPTSIGPTSIVHSPGGATPSAISTAAKKVGDESDPLAKQMESLRASAVGSVRRQSMNASPASPARASIRSPVSAADAAQAQVRGHTPAGSVSSNLAAPGPSGTPQPVRDYRNSAELVVGGYPPTASASRPTSPANPPTANFMQPPTSKPSSPLPVEQVLGSYEQSFPGERRSPRPLSRAGSVAGSVNATVPPNQPQPRRDSMLERPVSREGYAGIGARRSPSPQPLAGPGAMDQNRSSYGSQQGQGYAPRAPSPAANLDIALDATGQVSRDGMAERFMRDQQQQQQTQSPVYGGPQRVQSMRMSTGPPPPVQQPQQPPYGGPPAGNPPYVPNHTTGGYVQAPPPVQSQMPTGPQRQNTGQYYNPQSPSYAQAPPQTPVQQPVYQPPPQPQSTMYGQPNGNYYGQPQHTGPNGMPMQNGYGANGGYGGGYNQQPMSYPPAPVPARDPSPAPPLNQPMSYPPAPTSARDPSPAPPPGQSMTSPTGQTTEDGRPVLFYGTFLSRTCEEINK